MKTSTLIICLDVLSMTLAAMFAFAAGKRPWTIVAVALATPLLLACAVVYAAMMISVYLSYALMIANDWLIDQFVAYVRYADGFGKTVAPPARPEPDPVLETKAKRPRSRTTRVRRKAT